VDVHTDVVDLITIIRLRGDLDSTTARAAQEQILHSLPASGMILLDLSEVPFVSSAGLRTMLLIYRQAQCINSSVALVGLAPDLQAVLGATGFLRFFACADSIPEGMSALRAGAELPGGPA
jgi:anti-sigma B factor antagonist